VVSDDNNCRMINPIMGREKSKFVAVTGIDDDPNFGLLILRINVSQEKYVTGV